MYFVIQFDDISSEIDSPGCMGTEVVHFYQCHVTGTILAIQHANNDQREIQDTEISV